MKKQLLTGAAALIMAAALSMTSFASQWQQDETGWRYQNDDGSYVTNGWSWVDGRCYYFMPDGYCLTKTQTPDGYTVDETGAWVVNGVVQTQGTSANTETSQEVVQLNTLSFTVPSGFVLESSDSSDTEYYYSSADHTSVIVFASADHYEELDETVISTYQEQLLDQELGAIDDIKGTKSIKQFPSGDWYCYDYPPGVNGIPGTIRAYGRIEGKKLQAVMFAGALSETDADSIMNHNVR